MMAARPMMKSLPKHGAWPSPARRILGLMLLAAASACLSITTAATGTAAAGDDDWSIAVLMKELGAIQVIDATFVEKKQADFLSEDFTISGELYFKAPHSLRKTVTDPYTETISIDETTIIVQDNRADGSANSARFIEIDSHPAIRLLVESMRATMAGDMEAMFETYEVGLTGSAAQWNLELVPRHKDIKKHIEAVRVAGADNKLNVISIIETDNTRSTMKLSYNIIR